MRLPGKISDEAALWPRPSLIRHDVEEFRRIHIEGGTHNPFAPPFDFLAKTFLPLLNRMGPDQLLVPLALAGGGSYRTGPLSRHARTNLDIIHRFLEARIVTETQADRTVVVRVTARPGRGWSG